MEFRTIIPFPKVEFPITHTDKIMLMGSCFAENIGKHLVENKFITDLNPFGIIYNPASVARSVRRLLNPVEFKRDELPENQGVYHSFYHHSRFSGQDPDKMVDEINLQLNESSAFLKEANCLLVTFGTAWMYRLRESGEVVSNCHKLPDKMFERELLSVDQIVDEWQLLLDNLWIVNSSVKILFTVSPVRHWKDGAHGNQISKATLLLAIEQLCQKYPGQISYFPSYEILLDELRDYRFYAGDMLHPSQIAIEYIWQRFSDYCFTVETKQLLKEWQSIKKAIDHKPFRPGSETYRSFIMQTLLKVEQLEQKFPYFYMTKEKDLLLSKLK